LFAVSKVCWNYEAALTACGHAGDTNVPAFDDFADTELELERFTLCIGWVMESVVVRYSKI
jgi:hypothetical protein